MFVVPYLRKKISLILMVLILNSLMFSLSLNANRDATIPSEKSRNTRVGIATSRQVTERISKAPKSIRVSQEEVLIQNKTTHGWVMKSPEIIDRYKNILFLTTTKDPNDDGHIYLIVATYNDTLDPENRTYFFHLIRVNISYFNISMRRVRVYYKEIANYTVEINKTYNVLVRDMDSVILPNRTLYLAIIFYAVGVPYKLSAYLLIKYLNVSVENQSFEAIDYMDNYYGYSMFIINVRLACDNDKVVCVLSLGYYYNETGTEYVLYAIHYRLHYRGIHLYDSFLYLNKPKYLSNAIMIDNLTFVAAPIYYVHYDQDIIGYFVLNITGGNASIDGFLFASELMGVFDEVPEYGYIALTTYNNSTSLNLLTLFEAHTEFRQFLIYHTAYVIYDTENKEPVVKEIKHGIISASRQATRIINIDLNYNDNKTAFIAVKYNRSLGAYVLSHILFRFNGTASGSESYVWLGPYDFDVGAPSLAKVDVLICPSENIYGFAYIPSPEKNQLYPIVIFRDTDRDYLGNWEEINTFGTLPDNPDSDNSGIGDGINDGAEKYVYGTDPLSNDTDKDGLDDKFELEIRPNKTYPEYGNIPNLYKTDPLINDTDKDNITDYQEVTGSYLVDGRKGYRTDPTSPDTDHDGLSDYKEIFSGVDYWVNTTNNSYIAYPNATLFDTDNDNISDKREAIQKLNPTTNDTDGDGLSDYEETFIRGSNPHRTDTDGDGLGDGEEVSLGTNPLFRDTDKDNITDGDEVNVYGTDPLVIDTDSDGLSDGEEILYYKTNALNPDTDGDNITDGTEIKDYGTDPNLNDTDSDGLTDREEIYGLSIPTLNKTHIRTDPLNNDTDDDNLIDGLEVERGIDPTNPDTDNDELTDYEELMEYGTDPTNPDSDNDSLFDSDEILYGTDPFNNDTDNDNITDYEEIVRYGTDPLSDDTDSDGLSDYKEIYGFEIPALNITDIETDPLDNDTDDDGLLDGMEVTAGTDPTDPDTDNDELTDYEEVVEYDTDPRDSDPDNDNLIDSDEIQYNTDPFNSDSDGDNLTDYDEVIKYGTDPLKDDTDLDGISDYDEIHGFVISGVGRVETDPTDNDTDDDLLSDGYESLNNLDPTSTDTDKDLISDYDEIYVYGTNPRLRDTDYDSISDYDEIFEYRTNPLLNDTDGDGVIDGYEVYGVNITGIGLRQTDPFSNDTDGDNLDDYAEIYIYLTDPTTSDTDNDGLSDYEEININTNPQLSDSDDDGLSDSKETIIGTNPLDSDSDDDGLEDGEEVLGIYIEGIGTRTTDPLSNDTDGDGLSDAQEIELGIDPTRTDTDGDGLSDAQEITIGSDSVDPDTDDDGLRDGEEYGIGTSILDNDTDDDKLSDYEERIYGTYPDNNDSDGDGILDGLEVEMGTNPLRADTDGDGLSDYDEIFVYGTNATNTDTDGDGLSDWEDINYGADPKKKDTDGDGLDDYTEVKVRGTDPSKSDTDGDGIPDSADILLPKSPDWYLVIVIILSIFLFWARSYGMFRNWKRDIVSIGLSDLGGTLMLAVPEDFKTRYDINLISSGLMGIHTLTSEIVGRELSSLVLSGEVPVLLHRGSKTIMWVFLKRVYPRLIKNLEKIHREIESRYGDLLEAWSGVEEELSEIKAWLEEKLEIKPLMRAIGREEEAIEEEVAEEFEKVFGE